MTHIKFVILPRELFLWVTIFLPIVSKWVTIENCSGRALFSMGHYFYAHSIRNSDSPDHYDRWVTIFPPTAFKIVTKVTIFDGSLLLRNTCRDSVCLIKKPLKMTFTVTWLSEHFPPFSTQSTDHHGDLQPSGSHAYLTLTEFEIHTKEWRIFTLNLDLSNSWSIGGNLLV